jgi:predicted nucleic acid-binding protein
MKYVIDSSVAFKWVVTETDSDKAIRLREDFRNGAASGTRYPARHSLCAC